MRLSSCSWRGRVANVGLAALTVLFTALIGRAIAGPAVGLLAAESFSVSPLSLETSTQLRNEWAWRARWCVRLCRPADGEPSRARGTMGCRRARRLRPGSRSPACRAVPALLAAAAAPGSRRPLRAMAVCCGFAGALAISNHFICGTSRTSSGRWRWTTARAAGPLRVRQLAADRSVADHVLSVGWPWPVCGSFTVYALRQAENASGSSWRSDRLLWFHDAEDRVFTRWRTCSCPCRSRGLAARPIELARAPDAG